MIAPMGRCVSIGARGGARHSEGNLSIKLT
ncbi:hypothetical protein B0I31_11722 [Saccharothrix carnea]|uniref:Uncharacterized protein n=1 Tax=Saccharothrix carnea TaxID=1280637 RepID=A0A2P8I032_SACCR|nr:hypothetical protein B0I31_11722 [Saccharothrix carnea]